MILLENLNIMHITTSPKELAHLIYEEGTDWQPILSFLCRCAELQGMYLDKKLVSDLIIERIG